MGASRSLVILLFVKGARCSHSSKAIADYSSKIKRARCSHSSKALAGYSPQDACTAIAVWLFFFLLREQDARTPLKRSLPNYSPKIKRARCSHSSKALAGYFSLLINRHSALLIVTWKKGVRSQESGARS